MKQFYEWQLMNSEVEKMMNNATFVLLFKGGGPRSGGGFLLTLAEES